MKVIKDLTNGKKPNKNEEYQVYMTSMSNTVRLYYGKTKKECRNQYKVLASAVINEEWSITEK
jgi:hypothetical protein